VTFAEVMEHVAQAFEGLGVFVLAAGTLWSFLLAGLSWRRSGPAGQVYEPETLISRPTMTADRPHG
jgi:hypothetical protein